MNASFRTIFTKNDLWWACLYLYEESFVEYQVRNYSKNHGSSLITDSAHFKLKLWKNGPFAVVIGPEYNEKHGALCVQLSTHGEINLHVAICMKIWQWGLQKINLSGNIYLSSLPYQHYLISQIQPTLMKKAREQSVAQNVNCKE